MDPIIAEGIAYAIAIAVGFGMGGGIIGYMIGFHRGASSLDRINLVMGKKLLQLESQQQKMATLADILEEILPEEKDG